MVGLTPNWGPDLGSDQRRRDTVGGFSSEPSGLSKAHRAALAGVAAVLVMVAVAVPTSAGAALSKSKPHRATPLCSTLLSATKLDEAYYGTANPTTGKYSGVKVYKTRKWYYPYNKSESASGSDCFYLWTLAETPADYQGLFAPAGPTVTGGADMIVGSGLSLKNFNKGRAEAEADGTGDPGAFNPGHVRKFSFGRAAKAAYLEDAYPGTGPTYNNLAIYVLTKRNNYFAVYAWDATLPQLENIAKTVLKSNF
jgi:hypothetical protein